jgi:hypothetical protein
MHCYPKRKNAAIAAITNYKNWICNIYNYQGLCAFHGRSRDAEKPTAPNHFLRLGQSS